VSNLREVFDVSQPIEDLIRELRRGNGLMDWERQALQDILVELLRLKFKSVPSDVVKRVNSTINPDRLESWLLAAATAEKLSDVGISPRTKRAGRGHP
jgi:hypothetical protein